MSAENSQSSTVYSQLPDGYKQTDVGIIPKDWFVEILEHLSTKIGDGIHSTPEYVESSTFYFINGNNLINNSVKITENTKCVSEKEYRKYQLKLTDKTILLSINGTIGNLAYYNDEPVILGKSAAYINIKKSISKDFIFYFLQTETIKQYFEDELTGSTIRNLSLKSIRNAPIKLPPFNEQQAIAEALGNVDALITSLDGLITKKRNIKQGTIQLLLTGKKRLAGFSGDWETKNLGEVTEFANGRPYENFVKDNGSYNLITLDSIGINGKLKKEHKRIDFIDNSLRKDDIVIILSDIAYGGLLGLCDLIPNDGEYNLNQRVGRLRAFAGVFPEYLRLQINFRQDYFRKRGQGTSQRHIYKRDINALSIPIPKADEQKAIAQILSDIDAEIEALEKKREKYKAIKQGMMQELLTGKTRLI